jgi:hypothetical protein
LTVRSARGHTGTTAAASASAHSAHENSWVRRMQPMGWGRAGGRGVTHPPVSSTPRGGQTLTFGGGLRGLPASPAGETPPAGATGSFAARRDTSAMRGGAAPPHPTPGDSSLGRGANRCGRCGSPPTQAATDPPRSRSERSAAAVCGLRQRRRRVSCLPASASAGPVASSVRRSVQVVRGGAAVGRRGGRRVGMHSHS